MMILVKVMILKLIRLRTYPVWISLYVDFIEITSELYENVEHKDLSETDSENDVKKTALVNDTLTESDSENSII